MANLRQLAPIALFVYNRPAHTKNTIQALLANPEAARSELFVFSDAAKNDAAKNLVEEVRRLIHEISGFKQITIVEREVNWGLANSVIDGVSHLCDVYGSVIVLEDDLVVSPHFLSYMNVALNQYENEDQVMQIAGYMFPVSIEISKDALFLPLTSSWGWATWERSWRHFDKSADGYLMLKNNPSLRWGFDLDGKYPYYKMLEAQQMRKVNSWAIRWYLSVFINNGLVLYPRKSLVENNGFDGSGVNCVASGFDVTPIDVTFEVNNLPEEVKSSPLFKEIKRALPKPKFSLRTYLKRLIKIFKA